MSRAIVCGVLAALMAHAVVVAKADDLGTAIDLRGLGEVSSPATIDEGDIPLEEVARQFDLSSRRFYLSGMIGPSFAQVTSPYNSILDTEDTLFNAGGALGVAFERWQGQLRLEVEGMGRSTYNAPITNLPVPGYFTLTTNNWSAMTNLWRDLMVTERFGVYGGGGIGAGGYILGQRAEGVTQYATPAANFAWQFGGGLLWEVSERLTFDVGYRYFKIDTLHQPEVDPNQFAASELMFTLRLYEPIRNWRN